MLRTRHPRRARAPRHERAVVEPLEPRTLLATITWDGGGDGSTLTDPLNWTGDILPGTSDDAVISIGGGASVTHAAGTFSVLSLTCDEALTVSGGTISVAAASALNGAVTLSGGTLTGDGDITINGSLAWTSGAMNAGGATIIGAAGTFTISTNATKALNCVFRNDGSGAFSAGTIGMVDGSFVNNGTLTLDAAVDQPAFSGFAGDNSFFNTGTLNKTGALNAFFSGSGAGVPFNSSGTVNVNAGTIEVSGGGTNSGSVVIATHAALGFFASYTHASGAAYSGPGTLQMSLATHTFTGPVTLAGVTVLGGATWTGSGDVTVTGTLNWTSGAMAGTGQTIIALGGVANLTTSSTKTLQRVLVNNGVINHSGGALRLLGGTVTNAAGRPYNASGIAPITSGGGINLFNNAGVFRKSGTGTITIGVPFDNGGTLSVLAGILNLDGGGTNTGARNISAGATLAYRASYTHAAGSTLAGSGDVNFDGGTQTISGNWTANTFLKLVSGTLAGPGILATSGPFYWLSGNMTGPGSILINSTGKLALSTGGSKTLARDITNNGALHWLNGFLAFAGAVITNNAGKVFAVLPDGNVNVTAGSNAIHNAGILRKQSASAIHFTEFNGGVALDNTGLVDVRNGSLVFSGVVVQAVGSTLAGGSWQVYPATTLGITTAQIDTIGANATVYKVGSSAAFSALAALVANNGTINLWRNTRLNVGSDSSTFTNTGTISLDRGALLSVASDFVSVPSAVLNITIGGASPTLFGRVIAGGRATLNGSVVFDFLAPYSPPAGVQFQFVTANPRAGSFNSATIPPLSGRTASIVLMPNGVRLDIT
jgi:hypothetical protein